MNYSSPIFLISIWTGTIFIVAGLITLKFPPQKVNGLYGYRTISSMSSPERWDFAQKYSAKEMIKLGVGLDFVSLSGLMIETNEAIGLVISFALLVTIVVLLIKRTEKAIKLKFRD